MNAKVIFAEISDSDLDVATLSAEVGHDAAGAVVTFAGVVRNHDIGQAVDSIEYSSHPAASQIIATLAQETSTREGVHAVGIKHRVGHLHVGDVAMVAVVAASHRKQAFGAVSDLVDEVKARLPVWKNQHYSDGRSEWTGLGDLQAGQA